MLTTHVLFLCFERYGLKPRFDKRVSLTAYGSTQLFGCGVKNIEEHKILRHMITITIRIGSVERKYHTVEDTVSKSVPRTVRDTLSNAKDPNSRHCTIQVVEKSVGPLKTGEPAFRP